MASILRRKYCMEPESPPPFLYKYVGSSGIDLLENWRIKIGRLASFNDPFECLPSEVIAPRPEVRRYTRSKELDRDVYEYCVAGQPNAPSFKEWRRTLTPEMRRNLRDQVVESIRASGTEYGQGLKAGVLSNWGVCCLSEDPASILMWSHYADSHRGFVVRFDGSHPFWGSGAGLYKVHYSPERVRHSLGSVQDSYADKCIAWQVLIRTKADVWKYESEWRSVFSLSDASEDGPHQYLPLPDGLVRVVYGGSAIDRALEDRIRRQANSRRFTYLRVNLDPVRFGLILPE